LVVARLIDTVYYKLSVKVGRSFRNANQPSVLGKVVGLGQPGDALLKPGKP